MSKTKQFDLSDYLNSPEVNDYVSNLEARQQRARQAAMPTSPQQIEHAAGLDRYSNEQLRQIGNDAAAERNTNWATDRWNSVRGGVGRLFSMAGTAMDDPASAAGATGVAAADMVLSGPLRLASQVSKWAGGDGSLPFDADKGAQFIHESLLPAMQYWGDKLADARSKNDADNTASSTVRGVGQLISDDAQASMSPQAKQRNAQYEATKGFGALGFLATNPTKALDMVLENLPSQLPMLGAGRLAGTLSNVISENAGKAAAAEAMMTPQFRAAMAIGNQKAKDSAMAAVQAAAKDAVEAATAKSAPILTGLNVALEAGTTGAQTTDAIFNSVANAKQEDIAKNPVYQQLLKETGSDAAARNRLAGRLSAEWAPLASFGTAFGSLVTGGAHAEAQALAGQVTGYKEAAKGVGKEMLEETIQNPLEDAAQYSAERQVNPNANYDPIKSALEGAVVSMGHSGAVQFAKPASGSIRGIVARSQAQTGVPQPELQPTPAPPAQTQRHAEQPGYDPIAPNQDDLLRRMGVQPDPVADAAVASVESALGAGDPTAGLVASVMRGDALQPVHDLAAVRARSVLQPTTSEGGLFEPKWLPDAAGGESIDGLPLPKYGVDSQEKRLANMGLDARDAQQRQAIDAHKQASFAAIDAMIARQKAAELEQLHQDSVVPATIDRAESDNARNQVLASVAGEGEAMPTAMQLALQAAQQKAMPAKAVTANTVPGNNATFKAAPNISAAAPNIAEEAPNISRDDNSRQLTQSDASIDSNASPALTMQQTERGQWLIKGDMAQHVQAIREALPGTKLVVSQQKGQALVQMPADKNTAKQGKQIRKALDHLLLSREQLNQRDAQRMAAGERIKARNQQAQQIDHGNDDILQAVAKLGGINTEQALSEWWRGQPETIGHYNGEIPGNLRRQGVFAFKRQGGLPIDDMVRRLEGEGYLHDGATPNDLLDAIEQRRLHPAGMEQRARQEYEARQQEEAPGEFQQAYHDGEFADEFTRGELDDATDYFELGRQQREAIEAAAEAADDKYWNDVFDGKGAFTPTEEQLDAIFGPEKTSRTGQAATTAGANDAGRTTAGAQSVQSDEHAESAQDGFGLASYTASDLQRQEREAEQRRVDDERQRAAADKARQDEETRKEIRRRSEAAADTFTLGGNAEDNLTGQGGLFDAPVKANNPDQKMIAKSDGAGFATRDALRAAATRDGIPQSSLIEKRDEAGNWIGLRHEPDNVIDRIITDESRAGKVIGTSIRDLHSDDVYTLLMAASSKKQINAIADYIGKYAPRAAADAVKSHIDSALKQKGWATEESLYGGGLFDAPAETSSTQTPAHSPEKVPDLAPNAASSAEMDALKAEMGDAIGELASILGARKNLTPEEESRIIPVMSKIFRIAAKMGFVKFRDAAQHVMSQIRQLAGDEIADKLSIDNLQAGYINIASEIGGDKREALAYDSIEQLEKDKDHVTDQRSGSDLERNSADATPENGVGAQGVRAGRAGNGRTGRSGVESTQGEVGQRDSISPDEREAADSGERSDSEVYAGSPIVTPGSAGSRVDIGSTDSGITGLPVEPQATSQIARVAKSDHRKQLAKDEQREADKHAANASVADALPILTEGQQQDVVKAEARFALPDGYGMLFTNGTGTGKTFTGLGVIKRFVNNGKTNILVVAPNDKIIEDWQRSGKMLGLDLTRLENTNSAGTGPVITTYANMGANNALAGRDWDLVVHDEAHYLAMDKDGTNTNALKVLRAISLHPDGAYHRHSMLNADEIALASRLAKDAEMQRTSDNEQAWYLANETQAKADKLTNELSKKLDAIKADVASRQGAARTRVVFLSATPFAYEKTIDWANGYLFDYNEGRGNEENSYRGYNEGSNREQFFMQHLGYRMRYGKLTAPDAKVDAGLMQRQFNAYLKKKGSLSGRMLDVKADYDRRFILVDSAIGKRIDDAFEWLREKSAGTDASATEYRNMIDHLYEKFDYLARRYLLESIKAREVVPHIREHMALGRKVVVFHDYKKGGGFNPFIFSGEMFDNNAVDAFNQEFRDIINSSLFRQSSPIDMFKQEFPDVLLFNGDVPANQRRANVAKFQDDASGPQIILVQSAAGKEGISLHDTTGKHQRVLFNLGQPTQPTTAIQQEGRIYRTGQVTDAIFRYLNTGTNWEKLAFATTIAQRASAAENLGMGEMARALKDAFIAGFEESDNYRAGMEGEGKGGKERDRAANDALTEYDRARSFYFGTQKKNAQTKAKEGKDYFATPEPVGLKMAEFADVRPGESVLEPSAGHGAIARWFPENANRTAIEPSTALRARLAMVFDGKIIDSDFEGHNIVNKYDAIVMNPPFGVGGKTAVDHLSKAAGHLREGGRVVALLPSGPAADKRLDNFLYGETEREVKPLLEHPTLGPVYRGDTVSTNAAWAKQGVLSRKDRGGGYWLEVKTPSGKSEYQVNPAAWTAVEATGKRKETYRPAGDLSLVADIKLPSVTFERAGTGVMTHIIVLEKGKAGAEADVQQVSRDLAGIDNINDLFKRMENMTLPKRVNAAEPRIQESSSESGAVESSGPEAGASGLDIVEHTTAKGKVLRGVIRTDLTQAQAKEIDPYTFKKDGGYFIRDRYLGQGGTLNSTASHTTTQQRMTQQQLQDLLHKAVPPHLRERVKVAQSRSNNAQQPARSEDRDLIEAEYDPATGQLTLYADAIPTPERALFVLDHELTHYGLDKKYGVGLSSILLEARNNPMIAKLAAAIAVDRSMTVNSVRQDIADALGVPVARIARSAAIHRLQVETANEALAELNAAIERNDFAYLQDRYGVAVPKMMRNDLRGRLARLAASVKAWLAKLTGKQSSEYSDKQVWDLLAGVRETVRGGGKLSAGYRDGAAQHSMAASSKTINVDGVTRPTTNSNGQPIAQTEEGLRNFWRWFSPSPSQLIDGLSISSVSRLKRDSEALADFVESQSGISEADRFAVIPSSVFAHVASAVNNDKVLDAVIRSLPVDVVNFLGGKKGAAKNALHDAAVLEKVFSVYPASNVTLGVNPSLVAELLVRMVANAGAKITGLTDGPFKRNSAVLADTNDPILGAHVRKSPNGNLSIISGFGDSKVVDSDGKPLVVYHGTESDFDSFDQNKVKTTKLGSGFYFAKDPETANLYAGFSGSNVVPVYLRMERPLIASSVEEARQILEDNGQYMNIDEFRGTHAADMADVLAKAGFDGIMYDGVMVVQNPTKIKSAVGNQGTFNGSDPNILRSTAPKQPASAGFSLPEETKAQAAQREVQDNMNRWRQVLENVRQQGGQVDEQNDVYGAEERFHGRAATRIEDFARNEVEPLMQRMADSGHTLQEVEQYLLAQHAEEANAAIREIDASRDTAFGMEDGEAQSILAKFAALPDAAEFKRLANDFRAIADGTLALYEQAGIVSPESAHAMRQAYQFYVPVKGGDEDQAARQGTGKGLSVNGKQKRRMGHDMRDEHVLENLMRDRQRAIILAEKNNVGTYLLDLIQRNPDPKLWTINVLPKQKVLRNQVSFAVERNGQIIDSFTNIDAAERFIDREVLRGAGQASEFNIMKSSDPYVSMMAKPMLQENEAQVYVKGRPVRIQLHDPILAGQYRRMGSEQMGRIVEAAKEFNRYLSKVYTGYNPRFFVKNVMRDAIAGTINLTAEQGASMTAKAITHWPRAGAAVFKFALSGEVPNNEYGRALKRYRAAGGSTGAAYMGDLERQANTLNRLYENYTGAMASAKDGKPGRAAKIATRKLVGGLAHWFEVWNSAGENAFRLATFMAMEESGKTVAQSASMAKNVTVNFNRKGELTPQLGAAYLFLNPSVQGSQRMIQSLFGANTAHKAQAWALVGGMVGLALALAAMNRADDDDEWEAIPNSVKDHNMIIPLGKGRKLTIPLPYDYSFFVSLANRLDAVMHGESADKAAIKLASSFFESFSPVGNPIGEEPDGKNVINVMPTVVKMVLQPAFNINGFGSPMRPDESKEAMPDNLKMFRATRGSAYDKAAQLLSAAHGSPYENNWNDVSPETLKYWTQALTGGTGKFLADSASLLNVLAAGAMPEGSEVPIYDTLVRETTVKDARARFYDLGKDAKGQVEAWRRAMQAGDSKAASEYEQHDQILALGQMMSGYSQQASALRDLLAAEMQRDDLSLGAKRALQRRYEAQEAEVYREFIQQFKPH